MYSSSQITYLDTIANETKEVTPFLEGRYKIFGFLEHQYKDWIQLEHQLFWCGVILIIGIIAFQMFFIDKHKDQKEISIKGNSITIYTLNNKK